MSERNNIKDDPVSEHGVNDPVGGVDVKWNVHDNQTPHERAQWAADVRALLLASRYTEIASFRDRGGHERVSIGRVRA